VRRRADASAVEPRRASDEALSPPREQLVAFDEERAPLLEHVLECREVDDGGVGFHLTVVRIDRRVEREVGAESHLEVAAGPCAVAVGPALVGAVGEVRRRVGQQFDAPRRRDALDALQASEPR
jgi:hypothetical protein